MVQCWAPALHAIPAHDTCRANVLARSGLPGDKKLACQLDKATVNVGAMFSQQVPGRVSTEVSLLLMCFYTLWYIEKVC